MQKEPQATDSSAELAATEAETPATALAQADEALDQTEANITEVVQKCASTTAENDALAIETQEHLKRATKTVQRISTLNRSIVKRHLTLTPITLFAQFLKKAMFLFLCFLTPKYLPNLLMSCQRSSIFLPWQVKMKLSLFTVTTMVNLLSKNASAVV